MRNLPIVARVAGGQLLVALVSAALWWIVAGNSAAAAAFAGGAVAFLPSLFMAIKMFSRRAMANPKTMVRAFYMGEAGKFGLTMVLFLITIPVFAEDFLPLIVTYIFSLMVSWFALLMDNTLDSGR